jgi:hypothetical protein
MSWFDRYWGGLRTKAAPAPKVSDLVQPSARDVRLVRDVAEHVTSKVVPIVDMHSRTMETAAQANVMAIEVATRLSLEAVQRAALTAVVLEGASLDQALFKLDASIEIITKGLRDHRDELAASIAAAYAGVIGGQVTQP